MSFVRHFAVPSGSTSNRAVTAIWTVSGRREIAIGFEDGSIRWIDQETGAVQSQVSRHQDIHSHTGPVNDFMYWPELKLLLSASADHSIKFWTGSGQLVDTVALDDGIFALERLPNRPLLVMGFSTGVRIYNLISDGESPHHIDANNPQIRTEHDDIVKCVKCYRDRVYTAGYDRNLCIFTQTATFRKNSIDLMHKVPDAHDAGITCMSLMKDAEFNMFILTGSYDKVVKMWSGDGQIRHRFDVSIGQNVTSIAYINQTKNIIIAQTGITGLIILDPKSRENISGTSPKLTKHEEGCVSLLRYVPESAQLLVITHRHLALCKYSSRGPIAILPQNKPTESLCYIPRPFLTMFAGTSNGDLTKWESSDNSRYIYQHQNYSLEEANNNFKYLKPAWKSDDDIKLKQKKKTCKARTAVLDIKYCSVTDSILVACESGQIYMWRHDQTNYDSMFNSNPVNESISDEHFKILFDNIMRKQETPNKVLKSGDGPSVSSRVATFVCQHIFYGHTSAVSSVTIVNEDSGNYLLSAGWDKQVFCWNMQTYENLHLYGEPICATEDEAILSIDYNPVNKQFAFTAGCMVLVYNWSPNAREIKKIYSLDAHIAEVLNVKWHNKLNQWVTGGEDACLRLWKPDGKLASTINAKRPISYLTCNQNDDSIVAASGKELFVFDSAGHILARYRGHTDSITAIEHVPEQNLYLSASLDRTIMIWNETKDNI